MWLGHCSPASACYQAPPAGGDHNLPLRKGPHGVPFHGRAELRPQACVWAGLCRWSALHSCPVTLVLRTRRPRWCVNPDLAGGQASGLSGLLNSGVVSVLQYKTYPFQAYLFCVAELSAKVPGDSQWHLTPQSLVNRITRLICISG